MTQDGSQLERLIGLANEASSDNRREILRDVTEIFVSDPGQFNEKEVEQFGAIMGRVAFELEKEVRVLLSDQLSHVTNAPHDLIFQLATDEIEVARPVLTRSPVLNDDDLVRITEEQGQDHLFSIAERETVSETVSDALVERGEGQVLVRLARNEGAQLTRTSMEKLVTRSENVVELHEPLALRRELPPDLLNEMYFFVSSKLQHHILATNAKIDEATLEEALAKSRQRLGKKANSRLLRKSAPEQYVDDLERQDLLNQSMLVKLFESGQVPEFLIAFARMAEIDNRTARRIVFDMAGDALAIACCALQFETPTYKAFLTYDPALKSFLLKKEHLKMLDLYEKLPLESARRTMRFWRTRQHAMDADQTAA